MQVYAWRQRPTELVRAPKRPRTPWATDELGEIPTTKEAARRVLDHLIAGEKRKGAIVARVGVCCDLSPDVGIVRKGMTELTRRTVGDRVEISWLRGLWESLHFIYTGTDVGDIQAFARALIDQGLSKRESSERTVIDIDRAGVGKQPQAPFYIYIAFRSGGVTSGTERIAFGPRERSAAREAEASGRDGQRDTPGRGGVSRGAGDD